jgi:hypothetical protein
MHANLCPGLIFSLPYTELVSQTAAARPLVFKVITESGKELKIGCFQQEELQDWTTKIREASKMADEKVSVSYSEQ